MEGGRKWADLSACGPPALLNSLFIFLFYDDDDDEDHRQSVVTVLLCVRPTVLTNQFTESFLSDVIGLFCPSSPPQRDAPPLPASHKQVVFLCFFSRPLFFPPPPPRRDIKGNKRSCAMSAEHARGTWS